MPVEGTKGGSSGDLVFPRASASDSGTYRCVAKSEAGSFLAEVAAVVEREYYSSLQSCGQAKGFGTTNGIAFFVVMKCGRIILSDGNPSLTILLFALTLLCFNLMSHFNYLVGVDPEILEIVAPESVAVGDNFTVQCTVRNWEGEVSSLVCVC